MDPSDKKAPTPKPEGARSDVPQDLKPWKLREIFFGNPAVPEGPVALRHQIALVLPLSEI